MSALISWKNIVDEAAVSLIQDAGGSGPNTEDPAHPLTNLQKRGLGTRFKSAKAQKTTILIDNTANYYGPVDDRWKSLLGQNVNDVMVLPDGRLIAGGRSGLLERLNITGGSDGWGVSTNNQVMALERISNRVVIGGDFTQVSGSTKNRLGMVMDDGSDSGWNPAPNGMVMALKRVGNVLWIGGTFTSIDSQARSRLVTYDTGTMTLMPALPAPNGAVYTIASGPDGAVYIGGAFSNVGGAQRQAGIARFHPDGSFDLDWGSNIGTITGSISAIAVQDDGKVVIGGGFTAFGGVGGGSRNRLARLNADGTLDQQYDPNVNGLVAALAILPDGKVIAGGSFNTVGGQTRNYIAKIDENGEVDGSWAPVFSGKVTSMDLAGDVLYVGGEFFSVDGKSTNRAVKIDAIAIEPVVKAIALIDVGTSQGTVTVYFRSGSSGNWNWLPSVVVDGNTLIIPTPHSEQSHIQGAAVPKIGGQFRIDYDSGDTTAAFDFARLWIGPGLEIPEGVDARWRMGFTDSGQLDASAGRQFYEGRGVRTRLLDISFSNIKTDLAWGIQEGSSSTSPDNFHELQLDAGTTGEVIVIPGTEVDTWITRASVYGHIMAPWEIEHVAGPNWHAAFRVEEER